MFWIVWVIVPVNLKRLIWKDLKSSIYILLYRNSLSSYIGCRIPILPKFINRVLGHRGFTHSILCMVCCSFLLRIIPWYLEMILFAFCAGYLSHLILDMLNSIGVPLFYPYKKKFRIAWISSDSPIQWVISAGAVLVAAAAWLIP